MKKRASPKLEPDLVKEYEGERHVYVEFCERLHDLICRLLKAEECHIALTEKRAKEVESLRKTLEGIEKDIKLSDIEDLVGVRVVTLTPKDVAPVLAMLKKEFGANPESFRVKVHEESGHDKELFGYRATHVYFKFNCARANLTEWKDFKGLHAEVQIKTLIQHTWAVLRHKLIYKPIEGLREISEFAFEPIYTEFKNLAVHTQTADNELSNIEKKHAEIVETQRAFVARVKDGKAGSEELTNLSLDVFVKNTDVLAAVVEIAGEAGFDRSVNKPGSLENFVSYAKACGMSKIADVVKFLDGVSGRLKDLTAICEQAKKYQHRAPAALPFDVLIFLLVLDYQEAYSKFQSDYLPGIRKVINAVRASKSRTKKQQNKK
ncbi:MAG: pyrophosphokinae [Blastocatellia bacterium]|jgi:ppGpp synthetase/RelA/SpoT-type nucleotidyltranferase|nr:pyrophosphokinae [Blastocatellia bacterium]